MHMYNLVSAHAIMLFATVNDVAVRTPELNIRDVNRKISSAALHVGHCYLFGIMAMMEKVKICNHVGLSI
jgi:hypothetical protein